MNVWVLSTERFGQTKTKNKNKIKKSKTVGIILKVSVTE